jgi:hypothetical protein
MDRRTPRAGNTVWVRPSEQEVASVSNLLLDATESFVCRLGASRAQTGRPPVHPLPCGRSPHLGGAGRAQPLGDVRLAHRVRARRASTDRGWAPELDPTSGTPPCTVWHGFLPKGGGVVFHVKDGTLSFGRTHPLRSAGQRVQANVSRPRVQATCPGMSPLGRNGLGRVAILKGAIC